MSAWAAGIALTLAGWQLPRWAAGTRWRWDWALAIDLLLPALVFALVTGVSGRPLFAGIVVLSLGGGYAYADRAKRATLDEPIIFTDVFQAFDVFRHPQLALPFPNKPAIVLGAAAVVAAYVGLFLLERPSAVGAPGAGLLVFAVAWLLARMSAGPLESRLVAALRGLDATGDPQQDAGRLGPLGMHLVHGIVARGERTRRRSAAPVLRAVAGGVDRGPSILVQSESFFDARRVHPSIDRNLLPFFDRACREGPLSGRLTVPSWGANTVRTEFSVLTGLPPSAIGFDHFNPYRRFADAPIASIASRMREQGYRTLCLHPFDRTFYRRDQVLPNLGFDALLGEEAFAADVERIDGYISDLEVARKAVEIVRAEGPRLFLFVVTMENHGPWPGCSKSGDRLAAGLDLPQQQRDTLGRYLASLCNADAMLGMLMDELGRMGRGTLAFYGDHLPGFGSSFERLGLADRRSDYLVWQPSSPSAGRMDLPAEKLADAVLSAWSGEAPAAR